jgi:hypothetical protein
MDNLTTRTHPLVTTSAQTRRGGQAAVRGRLGTIIIMAITAAAILFAAALAAR